jgi:hypothetical protein
LGHKAHNVGKFLDDGLRLIDNFTASVYPRLKKFDKFDENLHEKTVLLYQEIKSNQ